MGLNIVAERKVSLADFGEGWGECYLIVRAASKKLKDEWGAKLTPNMKNEEAETLMREAASQVIVSGQVLSTNEDGTTQLVTVTLEDVPVVIDALGFAWLEEVVSVSSGAHRLKAKMN